jgi:metallo-beta-lactamase class B
VEDRVKSLVIGCAIATAAAVAAAQSNAEMEKHIAAAKAAAGNTWPGLFNAVCGDARSLGSGGAARGGGGRRGGGPPQAPPRETWHAEPVKVFDNLYYVGMTEYAAWGIVTSRGIILLDAIFDYSIEDEVANGLKKVGLDPAEIKYVIVSHGHLDHAGGAKFLQEKYGTRLIMSSADYDLLDQQNPPWKPKRDMVATDGQKLMLGDTTLTLYLTPGHTLGTISTLIPVRDNGQPHLAAAWGGTRFNFGPLRERLMAYAASADRFREIVAKAGADIIISNHTEFDESKTKLAAVARRKPGEANPYVVGKDAAQRYLTVAGECARAAVAGM